MEQNKAKAFAATTAEKPYDLYELEPEQNTFYSVVVDITHRCNMHCSNCYIPNRSIPDMDVDRLIDCIKRFPKRVEIRLLGGEPTLHPQLPEIVARIRETGHRPTMMTNGLKLSDPAFAKTLYDAGLKSVNISMNGADDDSLYLVTDQMKCAEKKMQALRNCHSLNMLINTNTIIMRGVNDQVPGRLLKIMQDLSCNAVMRFRNVGQLGRHALTHEKNYKFDELIDLVGKQVGKTSAYIHKFHSVNGYEEEKNVLFPLEEGKKHKTIWVKITDWSPAPGSIPDPGSKRRGRITQNFKVAPFFEHVKANEFGY